MSDMPRLCFVWDVSSFIEFAFLPLLKSSLRGPERVEKENTYKRTKVIASLSQVKQSLVPSSGSKNCVC